MKTIKTSFAIGLLLASFSPLRTGAAEIVGDSYNVNNTGSGFALGSGVNSGINPPTTRLTGSAAANLRYVKTSGPKADSAHTIGTNKFAIARVSSDSSTISLSTGTGAFDFGPVLNTLALSPSVPAVYDLSITIANGAGSSQRCSFAISSAAGTANAWDFGIQLYRAATSDAGYTVQKRMSIAASGQAAVVNLPMTNNVGVYPGEVSFVIRVTDAGAESAPGINSRVQVSLDGGASWFYDTATDPDLPSGWRFPGLSRFIYWDAAGGSGPVTYDNFSLNFISGPSAATRTWTGGGADDNWSTAANWGGVAPATGDTLLFTGTARTTNVNDIVDLTVPWVTFNSGGFSLSGNALKVSGAVTNAAGTNTFVGELGWDSGAVKTWSIANGSELVLNNTNSVEIGGDHTLTGGGTLRLPGILNVGVATTANPAFIVNEGHLLVDGGTYSSRGGFRIGSLATGTGARTSLTNGAAFSLTTGGANLRVGDSANPVTSQLGIYNSTLTLGGGSLAIPYAAGATSVVTQVGGVVSGGSVVFSDAGAGHGTYTIKDGTLETIQITEDTAAGVSSIYFDNAILRPSTGASNAVFFSGLNVAEIQAGGLVIDAQSDVVIAQPLSGAGTLIKSNYAAVTLTGANTYSGNTIVQSGKLIMPTVQSNSTSVQVADTAEFGVIVGSAGSTLSVASLNFTGSSFGTLSFDLATFSTPSAPLLRVPSLSVSGPITINVVNGSLLTAGVVVLVDYDGAIGGGFNFSLGSLPPGITATLVNNTANSSIDLNITGVPGYRWTGAISGDWDTSTENWINQQTASPSVFADGFPTEFLDGATTGNINLAGFPSPSAITVSNNVLPYVWSNGAITTSTMRKFGANSLTRVEAGADLITSLELNAGSFIVSNALDSTFGTVLSDVSGGTGNFVKQGASQLTLSSNSTYDGAFTVQEGTLKIGATDSLGSTNGATTVSSGGTLDLANIVVAHEPVIVSGVGAAGVGAIIDSATNLNVAHNLTDVTMVGDTTFGTPTGGRWDIRVRSSSGSGPGLRGNGFNLTKVGPGMVSVASQRNLGTNTPYWEMNLGNIVINEGILAFAESVSLGNPAKLITVNPGATLQLFDLATTNPILRNIVMTDGQLNFGGASNDTNVLNGSITLTGANGIRPDQAVAILNGSITGSGSLNMSANEPGRVYLNGANTYSGDTTVTNGTLGGIGSLAGNLVMLGGTNSPGAASGSLGTFTVNGSATLAGVTRMDLDRSQSPNSDRLVVNGTLAFGGALSVALGTGAASPQAGDVYQLFNKGSAGSFTTITLPNLSALPGNLAWDTNSLNANGTISVTGTATSPNISAVYLSGNNLVFSGTGGVEGSSYHVLTSTNVALPLVNWTAVATNTFGPGGAFSVTNAINPAMPQSFFLLRIP